MLSTWEYKASQPHSTTGGNMTIRLKYCKRCRTGDCVKEEDEFTRKIVWACLQCGYREQSKDKRRRLVSLSTRK